MQTIGGNKIGANLYSYISQIAQIEQSHVAMLIQFLYELDASRISPPPRMQPFFRFSLRPADVSQLGSGIAAVMD